MEKRDCGCDCDHTTRPARDFGPVLTDDELRALLEQKVARARRLREQLDQVDRKNKPV